MTDFVRKPLWYKDAVIYEAHVRGFSDSDADGVGDFRGLIAKLDYIRDLGVTAIWLLPFYPSPLRDDGYDIADYHTVNPAYGTLETFREFLEAAHARGLYVITEVVINHTSDKHPWFQRARRAPPGSPERDFYVWSHGKDAYRQARVIFQDFEPSNWTWDPVARAHYWHRFYHHQPDLNFDNPAVHDAVLEILDYWLAMGVDGLRLDAIPYLYEREGTNCENLPETHAFLRKLSAHVRDRFDDRMLLAEANQWPEDAVAYFGRGDECDMAFHFPLMTRLYMAVETEDRFPMLDILEQTPTIPENCQWAIFLRNHDELTLEMVTDEERDYMIRAFAKDRRARVNLGIRRRLAPLLGNNRRKIELMNALLLSLPGTPVIYYGDEIGMGDNIYLGDRDGVRTPMQWSADRNAGFSRAPAQKLYLPVIADTEHHYEAVNVEAQEASPASLLWWMRGRIRLRQSHPVFGRGSIRFLEPGNGKVLAYLREDEHETVLVVANLSPAAQATQLDLSAYRGASPLELTGGARFPAIGEEPWPVMLGGHDCLWFQLQRATDDAAARTLPDAGDWANWVARMTGKSAIVGVAAASDLDAPAWLAAHLARAPWFAGKHRLLGRVRVRGTDAAAVEDAVLVLLRAEFLQGDPEDYALWLAFASDADAATLSGTAPSSAFVARGHRDGMPGVLVEAQHLPEFRARLLERLMTRAQGGEEASTAGLQVRAMRGGAGVASDGPRRPRLATPPVIQFFDDGGGAWRVQADGDHTLRWFTRLHAEERPEASLLAALNDATRRAMARARPRVPAVVVEAVWRNPTAVAGRAETILLGTLQRHAKAARAASDLAREALGLFLRNVSTAPPEAAAALRPPPCLVPARLDFQTLAPALQELLGGSWPEFAFLLGRRLAELHRALARSHRADARAGQSGAGAAADPSVAELLPEPFGLLHQHALYHGIRARLRRALAHPDRLAAALAGLDDAAAALASAQAVLPVRLARLRGLTAGKLDGERLRLHGDPRLDRILFTGKDFIFTGFDGPPWLPVSERVFRISPLHDVAALVREILRVPDEDAARRVEQGAQPPEAAAWARAWAGLSAGLVLDGYLDETVGEKWLPAREQDTFLLLESFLVERLAYEIQNASDTPARAVEALRLLATGPAETSAAAGDTPPG